MDNQVSLKNAKNIYPIFQKPPTSSQRESRSSNSNLWEDAWGKVMADIYSMKGHFTE